MEQSFITRMPLLIRNSSILLGEKMLEFSPLALPTLSLYPTCYLYVPEYSYLAVLNAKEIWHNGHKWEDNIRLLCSR